MNLQENIRRILREETSFMDKMRNLFAKDKPTSDDRLLHLDSEMMGKIFTKLFNRPVKEVYGYSMIG